MTKAPQDERIFALQLNMAVALCEYFDIKWAGTSGIHASDKLKDRNWEWNADSLCWQKSGASGDDVEVECD